MMTVPFNRAAAPAGLTQCKPAAAARGCAEAGHALQRAGAARQRLARLHKRVGNGEGGGDLGALCLPHGLELHVAILRVAGLCSVRL